MNYTTRILFTVVWCFTFLSNITSQHTISSDAVNLDTACDGECFTYTVKNGLGGPYFWITTGTVQGSNNEEEATICWNVIGENDIQVVDFAAPFTSQSAFQTVMVSAIPKPEVIFPLYPDCVVRDTIFEEPTQDEFNTIDCHTVCSGSTATYSALIGSSSSVTWEIEGGTILSQFQEEITVEWNMTGSGNIKITESINGCIGSENYCIEILKPLDVDIVALNGGINDITICLGQEVYFHGIGSEDITQFQWDFGNNTYASGSSASAFFDQAGIFTVSVIGRTECGCQATSIYTVIVDSNPGPEIMCTGTVCGGDEQTYFAAESCSSYTWSISGNGGLIDGGGPNDDFITVVWGIGPVGEINLSTSGCNTPLCALATTVQIPIIDNNAIIEGPSVVCKDGFSSYTVQYYNGTDYIWSISGNGQIINGYGTNEITVEWDDSPFSLDQSTIEVSFDNCHLECGGQASKIVNLSPKFDLITNEISCTQQTTYINAIEGWDNATVNFEIINPMGISTTYPNQQFVSETFNIPGEYTLIATDAGGLYCNDIIERKFTVLEKPNSPMSINGPLSICKNEFYSYSVIAPTSSYSTRWIITDGTNITVQLGNQINIQWTSSGPYEITVNFYHLVGSCSSESLTESILPIANATISGPEETCIDETTSYDTGIVSGNSADWTITPSDAGSIKKNNDNTIDITWHLAGTHQLSLDFCGASLGYNVIVNPRSSTLVDFPEKVCSGEMATITIPVTSSTIAITDELDILVSNNNISVVAPGKYIAIITTAAGCEEIIPIVIDTFIPPSVRVSSPQENAFCIPHPGISIVALNTDDGYTYEWFHDGVSLGITADQITTTAYGDYHVVVTDQNGCMATSNIHTLYEWCIGDQPPGTCSGSGNAGTLQIGDNSLTCNNLEFSLKGSIYNSTSFTWNFGDPDSGINNTATGNNPIHSFSNAGFYYVFLYGNIPGERAVEIFTVPAAPRFDYDVACTNSGVQFNNHSTFIPGYPINQYFWDFGDPISGIDNISTDKDPIHIYTTAGSYTATLEIIGSDGCTAAYQLNVEVLSGPFGDFVVPQSTCSDEGLLFIGYESSEILNYEWDFGDPTSGAANMSTASSAIHNFSASGLYNISLTVIDINECATVITKPINITTTSISGQITANQSFPMCFGEEVMLDAPSGGGAYIWSNGESTQSITTARPGIYSVTIADPSGCQYIPDDINVSVEGVMNRKIIATVREDQYDYFGEQYFDSIVICQGEFFSFNATYINSATYSWSMGPSTNWYTNSSDFAQLSPGRHGIIVTITDPVSGCPVASEPFKIIVNELPSQITLSGANNNPCEGEPHVISVDSPDSDMKYYWNTGEIGTTITTSASGWYYVTAVNDNGCERKSSSVLISKRPDANRINVGCATACFPDTICTPYIDGASTYQWLLDGSPVNNVFGNDLIVNQAGNYQLVVDNFNGCQDTSEVFTIDAEPSDQSITGLVFIDINMNGIWDVGEELLSGVTVNIYNGITIESTTTTDANGTYLFDPITVINPVVRIDTTGLNLSLNGGLFEANVDFLTCIEDKTQDFPLIKTCTGIEVFEDRLVCLGETITIDNIVLAEGDTWAFTNFTTQGCDSITNIQVLAHPTPFVELMPQATCMNQNAGQLEISIMSAGTLQFAIDNPTSFSADLTYTNLSAGDHTLWLFDGNGCSSSYMFIIDEIAEPEMTSIPQNTCFGGNTGSVQITPVIAGNYDFSLDGVIFNQTGYFDGLNEGITNIYAIDNSTGCIHEYAIEIVENPTPEVDIVPSNTCAGYTDGSITISPITSGNYQYSIDGVTFSNDLYFGSLAPGAQTVFIMEDGSCVQSISVNIGEEPQPLVTFETEEACIGMANGQIKINSTLQNLEYSIDQTTYINDSLLVDLTAGVYQIYVRGNDNCIHPFDVEIEESAGMDVDFEDPLVDCTVTEVTLTPTVTNEVGDVTFLWKDGSEAQSITTSENGTYDVEVSDKCTTRSYSYDIELEEIIQEQPIYFPNIFSPNDNSVNDCFVPALNPETQIISYRLTIFDRWGNKFFETTNLTDCWDGSYNNKNVRAGVFVYLMELEYTYCVDVERITKYGDVTVLD
ncbi:MAG: gliding motility-associated-like protein [Halioglobus sp.]|jgi:gliding motility-associated-like protein